MKIDGPVWGVVTAKPCYHTHRSCPEEKNPRNNLGIVQRYENEGEAIKAGHYRPCPLCCHDRVVEIEGGQMIRLTVEQIDTLRAIVKIFAEKKIPLTLSQIADERGRKISTCFAIVKRLVRHGLVSKKKGVTGNKAVNGSILPTLMANKVLRQIA